VLFNAGAVQVGVRVPSLSRAEGLFGLSRRLAAFVTLETQHITAESEKALGWTCAIAAWVL
jgi:hypothetical protein